MIALTMLPYLASANMPPLVTDRVCLHHLYKHPLEIGSSLVNHLIQVSIEKSLHKKQMYYEQPEVACYYSSCHLQK